MIERVDVEVDGYREQIRIDGNSGPVVLLCSGLGGRALHWSDTVAHLADDHRVVRFDRPGTPVTPAPARNRRCTVRGEADRIAAVLDAVPRSEGAVLVGHSVGGFFAEAFARLYPGRTGALLLLDSSVANPRRLTLPSPVKLAAADVTATLLSKLRLDRPLAHAGLTLVQRRRPGGLDARMRSEIRNAATEPGFLLALLTEEVAYPDLAAELCGLRARHPLPPIRRMVATAHTGLRTHFWRNQQIRLAKTLEAEHVTISPAGHLVMIEHPRRTADLIRVLTQD
ncbi:alpha/beta hydrolase [Mycobacterium intermedium]|uniref:Alpha/beta hydrolase n=1 Tax=Mycobacterium intermedium TaxID=28445 RepID=A0A1E3SGY9_MYCIE|nr:alpha/beta hydrolase [Mycobacterium intermedium]MCV6964556.1 alpha/beta hydrolase [Mycobacterium intermedium]ODR01365.1 hypothetical protein BHQ20_09305 [Mycobacterium intermedium]OPE52537.1 alpha/beta hydrolase [Mycobacterium intermedium]ORB07476.1 alpha/beta hydrolase [Mycobacterium intermedium]